MNPVVQVVTEKIVARSQKSRAAYLNQMEAWIRKGSVRSALGCSNQAHAYAAAPADTKLIFKQNHRAANIGIVSAYNDMLSAHAPYYRYPEKLKEYVARAGHVAQMAGGVPAMCDGITQGQEGMDLSLFSRDTIALSTAIALTHQVFDGALLLGICDKIVPGLLMAALRFGHIPTVFVPAGPMSTGISNGEKAKVRQAFAKGEVGQEALLHTEMQAYHEQGTCTFYGTANSNQMLVEIMGLQLPGSSFLHPNHPLRAPLNELACQRVCAMTALETEFMPLAQMLDERSFVNAMVGLLATGGSTNHSLHLVAVARMAGIILTWQDLDELSQVVPLLARIYPNGKDDVNAFQAAGAMPFLVRELLDAGLLHEDVYTVMGKGLRLYTQEPYLDGATLKWRPAVAESRDLTVLAPAHAPFMREGGLRVLSGNLGKAVMKISAVPQEHWHLEAPARVFHDQHEVERAYQRGELNQDVVVVLRGQGPAANGMPELHKLIPALSNLQEAGFKVALVTDGRLSGASGKVPAAIHLCPEAVRGGPLAKVQNGDMIRVDAHSGHIEVLTAGFAERATPDLAKPAQLGMGRELFTVFRRQVGQADTGALSIDWLDEEVMG